MKKKMKIKAGDMVKVIAGKDKGKTGKVLQLLPELERVVVEGVNKMYRHLRSQKQGEKGQRVDFFGPIHISNVMLLDPETQKPTRVTYEIVQGEDGKKRKLRKSKKSKATF